MTPHGQSDGGATIFDELRHDHDRQRDLLRRLAETVGDDDQRSALFDALCEQLRAHADAEEHHFYTVLMTDDTTREKARHSVSEHHEIDELVDKLSGYALDGSAWLPTLETLADLVEHHLAEEEHEVFQVAGRVLSDEDKVSAAVGYRAAMDDHLTS